LFGSVGINYISYIINIPIIRCGGDKFTQGQAIRTISLKAYFLECELKVPEITIFNCCELEIISISINQFILIPADFNLELVH